MHQRLNCYFYFSISSFSFLRYSFPVFRRADTIVKSLFVRPFFHRAKYILTYPGIGCSSDKRVAARARFVFQRRARINQRRQSPVALSALVFSVFCCWMNGGQRGEQRGEEESVDRKKRQRRTKSPDNSHVAVNFEPRFSLPLFLSPFSASSSLLPLFAPECSPPLCPSPRSSSSRCTASLFLSTCAAAVSDAPLFLCPFFLPLFQPTPKLFSRSFVFIFVSARAASVSSRWFNGRKRNYLCRRAGDRRNHEPRLCGERNRVERRVECVCTTRSFVYAFARLRR